MESLDRLRPDPDTLLQRLRKEKEQQNKGKLTIFFGMCAGVDKMYTMLKDAAFLQYLIAGFVMVLVALICVPFTDLIGYHSVSLILLFTVSILPLKLRAGPVLLAATLGAVVWDFFFIPPLYRFSVDRIEDLLMLVTYFIIAIVTGVLSARGRAQEKAVRLREAHAVALYTLTKELSRATTQGEVVQVAVSSMKQFFNTDVVIYLGEPDGDIFQAAHPASSMSVDEKEFSVAVWVYWNEKKAGKFTDTLPFAQATYFPLSGPRYPLGVIGVGLPRKENLSIDQKTLLENFIHQIASALEREFLNEITRKTIVIEESERLYKTLFNSISHELRTPLATIMGASESLLHDDLLSHPDIRAELFNQVYTAAERLNRLVENLLNMTRLESGLLQPLRDWSDIQDLVHVTLKGLTKELLGRPMTIDISPSIPLVKMDFGLIEQALTNILRNVSEYTPHESPIEIQAYTDKQDCVIAISDHGPGFPPEVLQRIFEKFYRAPGTRSGGLGLGLSIAKGFVEAHKGTLTAENRPEGGARLIVRLPLEPEETFTVGS
jgi:two-component system sensor histidine kinase KdpD